MFGLSPGDTVIITGLFASVAAQLVSLFRENRNHRWDQEERGRLAVHTQHAREALSDQIADNTAKTERAASAAVAAYDEANHVNMKIADLGGRVRDVEEDVNDPRRKRGTPADRKDRQS